MKKCIRVGLALVVLALLLCLPALGAEEPVTGMYYGPMVRNTTEAFPDGASLLSGVPPDWSETGVFRDGVYEGYYAQLDGITRLFYDALKELLSDPAAAYTDANKSDCALSDTVTVPRYCIDIPYPEGISFPTSSASTKSEATQELGLMVYKHIVTAYDALSRDHPEMPWLSCCFGYSAALYPAVATVSDGQTVYAIDTEKPFMLYLVNPSSTVLTGCANGSYDAAVAAAVDALDLDTGLYDLDAPGKSDYDKVKGIHDYLCRTVSYDYDDEAYAGFDQCSYSALVSPYQTVCAGYASSAKALCDIYAVPCVEITGLGGERHAWSYVRMEDGKWYAMDCTWDDGGSEPVYDFFLKGSADPVPYGWATVGGVPFPESHIATSTWSNFTAMAYPELSRSDYAGYYLAAAPTAATATYGARYADVTVTGAAVQKSEGDDTLVTGKWFLGDWTDDQVLFATLPAQEGYPAEVQATVFFSQNPDFCPIHIYDDPYDYPLTATVPLTVTQAPLTIRGVALTGGAVTEVTFDGLKNGETLTLDVDYTATAVQNGAYYDVTAGLLDTDLARNYVLESAAFHTGASSSTVSGTSPTSLVYSHGSLALTVGQSQKISLAFFPADATALPAVAWSCDNTAVATVDQNGLVTAVAEGSATVSMKVSGFSAKSIPVTVTAAPAPAGVTLDKTAVYLTVNQGETEQLTPAILPAGAAGVVKWSSDDPDTATVDDTGLVTPTGTGFAMVTATLFASEDAAANVNNAIAQAQCMVSVFSDAVPATKVTLNKSYLVLKRGGTSTLTYTLTPENTTDKSLAWTSGDTAVVTVTSAGEVTAVGKGGAAVTLSTGTPGVYAVCDVEVVVPVASVTVDPSALSLVEKDTARLQAAVLPADTSYPAVTWSSDNKAVVTVDDTGLVTAVGPGTATVTAAAGSAAEQRSAVCAVTVAAEDFTLEVEPVSFDVLAYGYAQPQAKALVIQSRGNRPAAISSVTLDDSSVFTLAGSGDTVPAGGTWEGYTVRPRAGLGAGSYSATVTVTYDNGARASAAVAVTVLKADADYGDALAVTNAGAISGDFIYGDTIQVTFLPQPAAALFSVSPAQNEAALYLGDVLLSGPVTADDEGKYVLQYDTKKGLVPLGEQTLTFRYGGSDDLNSGGSQLPVTLAAKPLTAAMTALTLPEGGYVYDGEAKTPALTVTHGGAALTPDRDYTVSFAHNVNAGTAAVTVSGQGWYSGAVELTFPIAPQTGRELSLTADGVSCADTSARSFDLAPAVAALALTGDVPVYGALRVIEGEDCLAGAPAVDAAGLVTFALADGLDGAYTVTLALEVTGLANYGGVSVTLAIPIDGYKAVTVDLSGVGLADRAYNAQPLTLSGEAAGVWAEGVYTGDFTYTWRDAAGRVIDPPVDAGTYTLRADAAALGFRGGASRAVTITPAVVTAGPGSYQISKVYDGTTAAGAATGALEAAGVLPADSGVTVTAAVGPYESPDVGGQSALTVVLSLLGDDRGNYVLAADRVSVPCAITPRSATVTALDQQIVYGEALSRDVSDVQAAGLLEGHCLCGVTLVPESLFVPGGGLLPASAQIVDAQGREVTGNYSVTYSPGALTVEPRALTVTAGDAQVYRGRTPLTPDFTVDGLVEGDSFAAPQFTLPSTDRVGTGAILISGGTLRHAESYTVTYCPGVLTVLAPTLALDGTPRWDGEKTVLTLRAEPEDLLTYQETLIFAARYEGGGMAALCRGTAENGGVVFQADLTAQGGWRVFFLDDTLAPLCPPLELP